MYVHIYACMYDDRERSPHMFPVCMRICMYVCMMTERGIMYVCIYVCMMTERGTHICFLCVYMFMYV
jgi:hypothetical protein